MSEGRGEERLLQGIRVTCDEVVAMRCTYHSRGEL